MLKKEVCFSLTCCFFALGLAQAQTRKAGLWEVTSNTKMQKPGNQVGMFGQTDGGSSTSNAVPLATCYTREMIDNYGILLPPSLRDCQLTNPVKKQSSINADLSCSGRSNGKGSIETVWSDPDHATSVIHFVAKQKQGSNTISMGWTQEATAVFKSSSCGDVKPRTVPPAK